MKKDCSNCAMERFSIPCYDCLIGNNGVPSRWVEGENYVPDTVALRAVQQITSRAKKMALTYPICFAESAHTGRFCGRGRRKTNPACPPTTFSRWLWTVMTWFTF